MRISVPEDTRIEAIIGHIQCSDADLPENAQNRYSIEEELDTKNGTKKNLTSTESHSKKTFQVNEQTGELFLLRALDRETVVLLIYPF